MHIIGQDGGAARLTCLFGLRRCWFRSEVREKPTMALTVQALPVPLRTDEHGAVRVGDSQVLLDVLIREFENGADPESIVSAYSTLRLADVYVVIAYYLRHREEVDDYLRTRQAEAEKLRQEIEAKQPRRDDFRAKLLARRAQLDQGHPLVKASPA
jgi:uncharacterized protein (DUF433 family)